MGEKSKGRKVKMGKPTQRRESIEEIINRLEREFEAAGHQFDPAPEKEQVVVVKLVWGSEGVSHFLGTYQGCAIQANEPCILLLDATKRLVVRRSKPGFPRGTYVQHLNDPEITALSIKGILSWEAASAEELKSEKWKATNILPFGWWL
jgi:hypothetical protein